MSRSPPQRRRSPSPKDGGRGRSRSPPGGDRGGDRDEGVKSLLVRNIPTDVRPQELKDLFSKFGELRDVYRPNDYYTQAPKRFAFVEYLDSAHAAKAREELDGTTQFGEPMSIQEAKHGRKNRDDMRARDGGRRRSPPRNYGRDRSPRGRYDDRDRGYSRRSPSPRRRSPPRGGGGRSRSPYRGGGGSYGGRDRSPPRGGYSGGGRGRSPPPRDRSPRPRSP